MHIRKDKIVPSVTREMQVTHEEGLKPSRMDQTDGVAGEGTEQQPHCLWEGGWQSHSERRLTIFH